MTVAQILNLSKKNRGQDKNTLTHDPTRGDRFSCRSGPEVRVKIPSQEDRSYGSWYRYEHTELDDNVNSKTVSVSLEQSADYSFRSRWKQINNQSDHRDESLELFECHSCYVAKGMPDIMPKGHESHVWGERRPMPRPQTRTL
ncbi:hypothetical protein E4T47_06409 [Aureobasidium subglaciale]|nr:hypothetical protein E4T47_06409 [Aureobasidium subglaciale]